MLLERAEPGNHRIEGRRFELHPDSTASGVGLGASKCILQAIFPPDPIDQDHGGFAGLARQQHGSRADF